MGKQIINYRLSIINFLRRRTVVILAILFCFVQIAVVAALTDPEPNPFVATAENQVYAGVVVGNDGANLKVKSTAGAEFSGVLNQIAKYRDGGGPAEGKEFFLGDEVRFTVTSAKSLLAVQNANLLLCDQYFVGKVQDLEPASFTLTTPTGVIYRVHIGALTLFRDEQTNTLIFGATLMNGQPVRIHGVVNTNVHEIFAATFGAYIVPLTEGSYQKMLEEYLAESPFPDVPTEHPQRAAIAFVKASGIVKGYPDGNFDPVRQINRVEFTKILVAAKYKAELPITVSERCFSDFEASVWFARYVCFAREKQILGGYPDGTFRPGQTVNLAEAVKLILLTFGIPVGESGPAEEWFVSYFRKAAELKILPDGVSDPAHNLTRGEMAELLLRVLKLP